MENKLYGDGKHDDSLALQKMLNNGGEIKIPDGDYRIVSTLIVKSNTHIFASKKAHIFMCGENKRHRGDFLLSTNPEVDNRNISVSGGIWDGNNQSPNISRAEMLDENGYSGAVFNFVNIKKLELCDMTVINPAAYYFRFNVIDGFEIKNIFFKSEEERSNQDGLHFCGEVYNGKIENIRAETVGQTNDDLIAFNADDCIERVENLDMVNGNIENITVNGVYAEDCHTFLRLLSVNSEIRNVKISDVSGGMRMYAINMDAARACMTPLFEEFNRPRGVGCIEDVEFSNMRVHWTKRTIASAMVVCETQMDNVTIKDFVVDGTPLTDNRRTPILLVKYLHERFMKSPLGKSIYIGSKAEKFEYFGNINEVTFAK